MNEATGRGPYIQTYSGRQFFLADPREEDIQLEDFAHALARICRFTGHGEFYSVAQHCVLASEMAMLFYPEYPLLPAQMLVHDVSEAYLNDISSPLKSLLPDYRKLEERLEAVVERALGIRFTKMPIVKEIDMRMLVTERPVVFNDLVPLWVKTTADIKPFERPEGKYPASDWECAWMGWPPDKAEEEYLTQFRRLFRSRGWVPGVASAEHH